MSELKHRELIIIRRAAEDAIHACNRNYKPFVDAVSHPLNIISVVDMAIQSLQQQSEIDHLKSELDKTRVKSNQVDALHSSLIATLEREKDFALKQGKSERMFALRRCLTVLKRDTND